ncbi:hypothetical protein [Neolewinella antarctica]|uniref:Uncharacterized protein n=1 Tax=Neolewinella antarctica TaxID=442734 RepID=A0ABX0X5X5_9BACT|nr:hypothetical protein [Neolewinella antarctica]NJC24611.1 hypothetical protein [Neolewinella antarctica]
MKLPFLIYLSVFVILVAVDISLKLFRNSEESYDQQKVELKGRYERAVQTAGAPTVRKKVALAGIQDLRISPGFLLVHDEHLGDSIVVEVPEPAAANLVLERDGEQLTVDFDRAVRLNAPVRVRANLNNTGSSTLRVELQKAYAGRTRFQPDFTTKSSLTIPKLTLIGVPSQAVSIDVETLSLLEAEYLKFLRGRAGTVELEARMGVAIDGTLSDRLAYGDFKLLSPD